MRDLIYNQRNIPKEKWRYGLRSSAAVGCGWIAVYNALQLLGRPAEPEKLIRYFERQLPLLHGNTGTSFWGPALYFRQKGFPVKMRFRRSWFDELARNSDVCILFYYWRQGFSLGAHFVTVERRGDGYVGYNTYSNSTGPDDFGPSIEGFLKRKHHFGAILTGIRNKQ